VRVSKFGSLYQTMAHLWVILEMFRRLSHPKAGSQIQQHQASLKLLEVLLGSFCHRMKNDLEVGLRVGKQA
jgi:hypothetical protein